jgi:hypothetical protein
MSLQFLHDRNLKSLLTGKGGTTYAVDTFNNLENKNLHIKVGDHIGIDIGIAQCSDVDCFNKKIGRELSSSRLTLITFKVYKISKWLREDNKVGTKIMLRLDNGSYLIVTQSSEVSKFHVREIEIF